VIWDGFRKRCVAHIFSYQEKQYDYAPRQSPGGAGERSSIELFIFVIFNGKDDM